MSQHPFPVIVATNVYRLCLFFYPRAFRSKFGCEMTLLFRDDTRRTWQQRGFLSWIGLCFLVFFDLVLTAIAEHIREGIHMPLDKLVRYSGFAAFGAPIFVLSFTSNSFWDVVNGLRKAVGLRNGPYIHQILAGIGAVLMAYAFFGLYRRLATRPDLRNAAFFGLSIISCLLAFGISVTLNMRLSEPVDGLFYWGIFLTLVIGLAGMGWMTWRSQALGFWSFTPWLISGSFLIFALTVIFITGEDPRIFGGHPLVNLELAMYTIGWWMLGYALLSPRRDHVPLELKEAETGA
ncbi:MAG: hypothetical protein H6672_13790 [Anaerolineaceae bacterium]|nr:hypothetical protein [Anaerolineaceae bacterium]